MDGLSRWDLVLWVVLAYAFGTGVLVAIHSRHAMKQRLRDAMRHIHRGSRG
ncbi:MAG: hypothetical protein IT427_20980 [Pirellulales bacterium]|nr:hypothetical protein [Pirellulales bacterium]